MTTPIIGDIISQVGQTVRQLIPDPQAQAQMDLELAKLENNLLQGQITTNTAEAANVNLFVSGWRPFVGWVCGTIFAYSGLIAPLVKWGSAMAGHQVDLPVLDPTVTLQVLLGMLGLAGMRTFEKTQGVAAK